MNKCDECGSYAINHHCHGRDGSDPDLCDVCYWRKRAALSAQQSAPERDSLPVGVPDGYALVPVEPNQAMLDAAMMEHAQDAVYRAMVKAAPAVKAEQVQCSTCNDTALIGDLPIECHDCCHDEVPSLPAAVSADLTAVRCQCCATEYPHDSYDAGFIAGSGMCQVCDAAMPPKDLPAAGSAVEEVEVVAWMWRDLNGDMQFNYMHPEGQELMTVAQHERIVAALSAQQSAQPEFCCKHSYKVAKQAAWGALDLTQCKCDHNEYCEHCWPDDFREGGKWHGGFETKQSAPERVSVPRELLEDLRDCANECYNHARFRGASGLDNYERLTEEADALLNGGEA